MRILVLGGAGAMGQVTVRDLFFSSTIEEVVIGDVSTQRAERIKRFYGDKVKVQAVDISDAASLAEATQGSNVVINCAPYQFNLPVMEACLTSGCHYLDLGGLFHTTRKQMELDARFKEKNLLAVLGMGAAPGMTNVMAAHAAQDLDEVEAIEIVVGGVEFDKVGHPFLPPYSLDTVLDEYALQPMVYEDGRFRAKQPMSAEALVDMPWPVGKVKTVLTLHSEVATLPLTYKSKGIRRCTYRLGLPDEFHEHSKFLVKLGFASKNEIKLGDVSVVPRQMLARMVELHPAPETEPNDCEVIRVDVRGRKGGRNTQVRMESIVYSHPEWKISCGALDTGVPPSIVAQMIMDGQISERGALPPEQCVPPDPFFAQLAKRAIPMRKSTDEEMVASDRQPAGLNG
jgi:saccharopine dehydrogenase-like NADP-dependent oxidoreductase